MAFYLGRDIKVYITTEGNTDGYLNVTAADGSLDFETGAPGAGEYTFAAPMATAALVSGQVNSLTGCDVSIGAMDEDITYFGFRQVSKAEIKKETTVSMTRTKNGNIWESVFQNGGRWGSASGATGANNGLQEPNIYTGFRVYVELASGSSSPEVLTIPNAVISGYTVSLNVDGTAEETMEFSTNVTPVVQTTANVSPTEITAL